MENFKVGFLMFILLALGILIGQNQYKESKNRYEIKQLDTATVMYDKQNGLAWRNVWCDNKEKIANCWQLMEYQGAAVPDGENKIRDERFKRILEESKNSSTERKSLLDGYKK